MAAVTSEQGLRPLARDGDFLRLWVGETVSLFGTQVTVLALPLTAVLVLDAGAAEVGFLNAARFAPFVAVILFAGVWIDRHRRRPVLIQTNAVRAALIALVPLAAYFELLRMELLYVIGFTAGVCTVFFDLAYQSYLPSLVSRSQLTDANTKLQASASAAEVGGPGLGGLLVQIATAPYALLIDAATFLFSVVALSGIRKEEPAPEPVSEQPRAWPAIREGFSFTFRNPYLRPIAGEAATFNLFEQAIMTVFVVYAIRELSLSPGLLGLVLSLGAAGALIGSVLASYPERRFGLGRTIAGSMVLACTVPLAIPLITAGPFTVMALAIVFFIWGFAVAVSNVHVVTLRQAVTPDRLLGRMNASYRFFTYGAIPVGALLGGLLGATVGLRATLVVGGVGLLFALLWILLSPLGELRKLPNCDEA